MNFNIILIGITLLISLITLYTIYNVNNSIDKLLLDDDSDDLDGNKQRLSIIKYAKENNSRLNSLESVKEIIALVDRRAQSIAGLLSGMMKYNRYINEKQVTYQVQIVNMLSEMMKYNVKVARGSAQIMTDIREFRGDVKTHRGLLFKINDRTSRIADAVTGVPVANSMMSVRHGSMGNMNRIT